MSGARYDPSDANVERLSTQEPAIIVFDRAIRHLSECPMDQTKKPVAVLKWTLEGTRRFFQSLPPFAQ
jgi:hypothetical protein